MIGKLKIISIFYFLLLTAANDQSVAKPVEVNHEALKSEGKASIQLVHNILILHIFFRWS